MYSVQPACQQDPDQNPSSVILVIINLELIISLHCHVLRSDSRCSQPDIHQPSICSECKYSAIIQFGRVYLAHQSDGAVVSNLEWEKLAEVGTCGGQRQERSLKINYLWTWIAWTQQTCCLLSSFDCFASCVHILQKLGVHFFCGNPLHEDVFSVLKVLALFLSFFLSLAPCMLSD